MSAILPQGLIHTTRPQFDAVDDADCSLTNSQILNQFWKVHAIQSDLIQDAPTARSRNLFWRIWSCPKLERSISPGLLNRLWVEFNQEIDFSELQTLSTACRHDYPALEQNSTKQSSEGGSSDSSPKTVAFPQWDQVIPDRPVSKTNISSSEISASRSRGDVQEQERSNLPHPSADSSSSNSRATTDSSSRPPLRRAISEGRPRSNVTSHASKSKLRPQLGRRKSSQARSQQQAPPKSPRPIIRSSSRSTSAQLDGGNDINNASNIKPASTGLDFPAVPATGSSTFELPSASSWQSVEENDPERPTIVTLSSSTEPSDIVFNRDFRGKFVEEQRKKVTSTSNLAALGRMKKTGSVVRFADEIEMPEEFGKAKGREQPRMMENEPERPSRLRRSSGVFDDDDHDHEEQDDEEEDEEDSGLELPRTKSQLSLLIHETRKQSGSQNLGPSVLSPASKGDQPLGKEEEKLLSMGRKDGVTKAGGVQLPERQRLRSNSGNKYRSPSPPPLF